jgi:carbamoyl-phosphate synthase large subunit
MSGTVFISLNERDKKKVGSLGRDLAALGFKFLATDGTAAILRQDGIEVEEVFKVGEGRPNIVDQIINKSVDWIINTPMGAASKHDEVAIRRTALENNIPTMTTLAAARAAVQAIRALKEGDLAVISLQEYHAMGKK